MTAKAFSMKVRPISGYTVYMKAASVPAAPARAAPREKASRRARATATAPQTLAPADGGGLGVLGGGPHRPPPAPPAHEGVSGPREGEGDGEGHQPGAGDGQ